LLNGRIKKAASLLWLAIENKFSQVMPTALVSLLGKHEDITQVLENIAVLEEWNILYPTKNGDFLKDYFLLADNKKLIELGEAASKLLGKYPDSVFILFFRAVSLARNEQIFQANKLVSDAIARSVESCANPTPLSLGAKKRTIELLKIWRVLDWIGRNEMEWLFVGEDGPDYLSANFLQASRGSNLTFSFEVSLALCEPLLQGRHVDEFLSKCGSVFDQATCLREKLLVVTMMQRRGHRRLADYHAPFKQAATYFEKTWVEISKLISTDAVTKKVSEKVSLERAKLLKTAIGLADELGFVDRANLLQDAMILQAQLPSGSASVWTIADALAKRDPIKNRQITRQLIDNVKASPTKPTQIFSYFNWALHSQEYEHVFGFYKKNERKTCNHSRGLVFANILMRMGKFNEAVECAQKSLATTFNNPGKGFNPHLSWRLARQAADFDFARQTANLYLKIPQPQNPKGVVFVPTRTSELIRWIPVVVLMELKQMGWAVVPLVKGTLPIEKTGIPEIDRYAGCLTLEKTFAKDLEDSFAPIEDFDFDADNGTVNWRDMDLSHVLWEDASVYMRRYNIDYKCPVLKKHLAQLVHWTKVMATILQDMEKNLKKTNIRVGFMTQFTHRFPEAIFRSYCDNYGDPDNFFCVQSANGYQNYFANFSTNLSTKRTMRNVTKHPIARTASFPIPERFEAYYQEHKSEIPAILEKVKDVTKVRRSTKGKNILSQEAKYALECIYKWRDEGGKVACAFGKVVCDSAVPYDGGLSHKNMKDWINHTIKSVDGSDTLLLIKPHPHEHNEQISTFLTEFFFDLIETEINDNVILLGHDWFDIHSLNDFVDLGVIYNGTTSVELGIMGLPCILASHFAPIDYPIGHTVPKTRAEYQQYVRFEKQVQVADELRERAACWLHYLGSDNISIDYRYNARQITNKIILPSYWFEEDVQKYLSQGDENVTKLARRVIS